VLILLFEDFTSVFSAPDIMKLYRANDGKHKWVAEFKDGTHTKFGAVGMDDYTLTHDKEQRERYRTRHRKDLATGDPKRAGFLSYHILWGNSTSLTANLTAYKHAHPSL
jgi:hypothetical protein